MEIKGNKTLPLARTQVWRALNDAAVLQRCLPGCDVFEADGEYRYRVGIQATVGPVRARFTGKLVLHDVIAPTSYALTFEGSGGVAGFGKGTAHVVLEDADGGTTLRYTAQATVGGRLAQVGARLIDGVTRRMADDFFNRFAIELSARDTATQGKGWPPAGSATARPPAAPVSEVLPMPTHAPSATAVQVAVIAAAVSAVGAAVAVLAAAFAVHLVR